jgi:hypothetical protein
LIILKLLTREQTEKVNCDQYNMRLRDTIIIVPCVLFALVLMYFASTRLEAIHSARGRMGLISNTPLENAPPSLAFATVAMGAFRGIVVDILWMRADKLKEEGQFFDAKQIADWITTLQPRFAQVWDFQAWNMAYNISVAMPASQWQERWRWVKNGYELLRDKGIEQNPHSIQLYRSLAWIFQHKMGSVIDDCHKHYKRELALSMRPLLSPNTKEHFKKLIAADHTLSEIMKDEEVSKFISSLKEADPGFDDEDKIVNNYISLRQFPSRFKSEAHEVINRFRGTETLDRFDIFAKAYHLRNEWKLDPEYMHKINDLYGPTNNVDPNDHNPLNWEHPATHAIYWAEYGLENASKPGEYSVDEKNTDRIVFHSLQELYKNGKMIIYPVPGREASVFLRPDLKMFDSCEHLWKKKWDKYTAMQRSNPKGVSTGYRNLLKSGVGLFYQAGHVGKSGKIYLKARKLFPDRKEFNDPLEVYVRKQVAEDIKDISINEATELIIMSLREGYFRFAVHDDDNAYSRENWAHQIYDIYQKEFADEGVLRIDLPSFGMLRYLAFIGFINDEYYPENLRKNLLTRIKVERPDLFERLTKQESDFIERSKKAAEKDQNGQ